MNRICRERGHNCAHDEANYSHHIWDRRDENGQMGATACIVVHAFIPYYERTGRWEALAWWVHDHLPYSAIQFFPKFTAFNLNWHNAPKRTIYSYIPPRRGWLTKPGMSNYEGSHSGEYDTWQASWRRPERQWRQARLTPLPFRTAHPRR